MSRRIAALTAVLWCLAGAVFATDEATPGSPARILGDPDAPVTLIEFASMSCPHCAAFHAERLPAIKEDWIDTGKVKLEFRDFPLNGAAVFGAALAIARRRTVISPGST